MPASLSATYAETMLLLMLWSLAEPEASKSKFMPSSKAKSESAFAYQEALKSLESKGALSVRQKTNRIKVYSLTSLGKSKLANDLLSQEFMFSSNTGAKTANAILSWFRSNHQPSNDASSQKASQIKTYDEFREVALQVHQELDRDYNLANLVPIYRVRRAIGNRVSRLQFSDWLLEMQANDLIQLISGDLYDVTQDQREDSVIIPGGNLRFYVQRL